MQIFSCFHIFVRTIHMIQVDKDRPLHDWTATAKFQFEYHNKVRIIWPNYNEKEMTVNLIKELNMCIINFTLMNKIPFCIEGQISFRIKRMFDCSLCNFCIFKKTKTLYSMWYVFLVILRTWIMMHAGNLLHLTFRSPS